MYNLICLLYNQTSSKGTKEYKKDMKKLIDAYMAYKKITIPVTVLVAALIVGGTAFGIHTATTSAKTEDSVTASKKVEKAAKVPEYICYDQAGTYSDKNIYKAGDVSVDGVTVENATFDTLTITEGVGDGSATLNDVTVKKTLVINGGGTNSVHINGGSYKEVISNDYDCHIVIDEKCSVDTLTVPSSALVEVNGTVKVANVVPSSYEGEIAWECGFKAGEKAKVESLNIAEEVKKDVKVEDTTGKAVKEQKALTKAETNKVQNNAQSATSTVQNATSTAKQEVVSGGGNTSASNNNTSGSTSSNNTNNAVTPSSPSGSNSSNSSSTNKKPVAPPKPEETVNNAPIQTCPLCGEKRQGYGNVFVDHNCPNTTDYYGNIVPKDSRYVVAVGGYGTKKYSDGTYEVTEEGRNALRQSYESEKLIKGDDWSTYPNLVSLDAYVINHSGI